MIQKAQEIQAQFEVLSQKISRLRIAIAIENDPATKFKLEKQLEETETECEQLEQKLIQLQHKVETYQSQTTPQSTSTATGIPQIDSHVSTEEEIEPEIDVHLKKIREVDEVTGLETDTTPEGSTKVMIEDVKKGQKIRGMRIKKA